MEVFLTDNRGFGVRAAEPIARGTFIVEYTGAAVRRATGAQRLPQRMAAGRTQGQQAQCDRKHSLLVWQV